MRITSQMMQRQFLSDLNISSEKKLQLQNQTVTGMKFNRISDDPYNASKYIDITNDLNRVTQYQANVDTANTWMSQTETALSGISESLQNIDELAESSRGTTVSDSDRQTYTEQINQLKEHIVSLLNTEYGNRYLFGGYNTRVSPVQSTSTGYQYNSTDLETMTDTQAADFMDEKQVVSISSGVSMEVSLTAVDVTGYGEDNMLSVIDQLAAAVQSGDDDSAVEDAMDKLEAFVDTTLNQITLVGSKQNRVDAISNQLEDTQTNLKTLQTEVGGVPYEEAVLNYSTAKSVYEAALEVGATILQPSLLDFMS